MAIQKMDALISEIISSHYIFLLLINYLLSQTLSLEKIINLLSFNTINSFKSILNNKKNAYNAFQITFNMRNDKIPIISLLNFETLFWIFICLWD